MAAAQLPHLPDIERVSPLVLRILGGNPGKFQLQGTNTYLIGTGPSRILIDTGEGKPIWRQNLAKALKDEGNVTISHVLLTHWHPDHVRGVPDALELCPKATVHQNSPEDSDFITLQDIADGQTFDTEGATLRAVHSPGHTTDHMAFVLEQEDAMFTADNVLGHGTAVFEDLTTYMASLDRMKGEFRGRAYPGHGAVIGDGPAKIEEYITHRKQREVEALEVLGRPPPSPTTSTSEDGSWGSMEMVKVIYAKYPEALHGPAEGSLLHVLRKLQHEGKTQEKDGRWRLAETTKL